MKLKILKKMTVIFFAAALCCFTGTVGAIKSDEISEESFDRHYYEASEESQFDRSFRDNYGVTSSEESIDEYDDDTLENKDASEESFDSHYYEASEESQFDRSFRDNYGVTSSEESIDEYDDDINRNEGIIQDKDNVFVYECSEDSVDGSIGEYEINNNEQSNRNTLYSGTDDE